MHLAVNKDTLLNAKTWNVYVASYAKKDMNKGDKLGSIGGDHYYGVATNKSHKGGYLPVGIAENAILIEPVKKGSPILLDQVEIEQNTIYKMWKDQEEKLL